jgi:hypothetical protein
MGFGTSIFTKGQSKRIWGELYKVIDASDIIVQVLGGGHEGREVVQAARLCAQQV